MSDRCGPRNPEDIIDAVLMDDLNMDPDLGDSDIIVETLLEKGWHITRVSPATVRALVEALEEYAVLGHGRCTIGKPAVEKARAALARAKAEGL